MRTIAPKLPQFDTAQTTVARDLALLGYTNKEIAGHLNVPVHVFERWAHDNERLKAALIDGRSSSDSLVVNALLKRAIGYDHPSEKIVVANGIPIRLDTTTHYPADTGAALAWLRAKVPQVWQEQTVNTNINVDATPKVFALPANMTREQKQKALEAVEMLLQLNNGNDDNEDTIDLEPS